MCVRFEIEMEVTGRGSVCQEKPSVAVQGEHSNSKVDRDCFESAI
jgi:hypothetical protein